MPSAFRVPPSAQSSARRVAPRQFVRVTGGPYNGYEALVAKVCDQHASILVNFEGRTHELVTETRWLVDLEEWKAARSAVERRLRGTD